MAGILADKCIAKQCCHREDLIETSAGRLHTPAPRGVAVIACESVRAVSKQKLNTMSDFTFYLYVLFSFLKLKTQCLGMLSLPRRPGWS